MLACITFAMVTAKVVSGQYLFWLYPTAIILPNRAGKLIALLYLIALLIGQLYWPTYWALVSELTLAGTAMVLVRNLLLMAIGIWATIIAARWTDAEPTIAQ